MTGNTQIIVDGNPNISGSIFGAGDGVNGYVNMAKLNGNSTLNLLGNIKSNVYGGGNIAPIQGDAIININNGNHTGDVYGGGNVGKLNGNSNITIKGGSTNRIFGGSNAADANSTKVTLAGGQASTIFGGSNTTGNVQNSNIETTSGNATVIYGGNNAGGKTNSSILNINGGNITSVYGGGNQADTDTSKITILKSDNKIQEIYGGGKSASVTTTNIECNGGNASNVFGGSNTTGTVNTSNVNLLNGSYDNIYGGNNAGGTAKTTYMTTNGGYCTNMFGGGNKAKTDTSNVKTISGNIANVYGGGNEAGVTNTNVHLDGGCIQKSFGGANKSGDVSTTNVTTETDGKTSSNVKMDVTCDTKPAEQWETTTYKSSINVKVTIKNNTDKEISKWNAYVTIANGVLNHNYSSSEITENNGTFYFTEKNKYYGNNTITAGDTFTMEFQVFSMDEPTNVLSSYKLEGKSSDGTPISDSTLKVGELFGGNNAGGTTSQSNITIGYGTIENVYGGNNDGGVTTTSHVTVNDGTVTDVYGGGDKAVTNETNVLINGNVKHCVYGGGNEAGVNTNTNVTLNGATVEDNVYGGGNEGTVTKNTYVHSYNSKLLNSLYAGGNGITAIVYGNTNLTMDGTSNEVTKNIFGGGNKAATGKANTNNSASTVNIVNGSIGGNVYGAANTSVVYGNAKVNIGYNAVKDTNLTQGDIKIEGTVFGGGEANESGSTVYDFSFISVTKGIDIDIDGKNHNLFYIKGNIFGSGNASSTSGDSFINLKNYGSVENPENNVSLQRANRVVLDNSAIALSGATDRTNEYSSTYFSISRVDEVKLQNNSTLYLNCGANLLKKLSSVLNKNGTEEKAYAKINSDTGDTERNVDNRVYMAEGKNLNIATNEQVTAYGEVYGMTFFGLFTNTMNPATSTGLYNHNNNNNDEITNLGTFSSNSYVLAQHKPNHDTTEDGFYSNYNEEGKIKSKYIETTPEDDVYYIWLVGEKLNVKTFEISLTASKYATLGTYELGLTGFAVPNTKFSLVGFSAGLANGISLINPKEIKNVDPDQNKADSIYGLSMRTGNNGWKSNSTTSFLTQDGGKYVGSSTYDSDNSSYTPSLNFCLYHSENLSKKQNLGTVKVRMQVQTPIDDLNYDVSYIDINVSLASALYQTSFYEAAITPGEEFGLFTTTETNITDDSVFSTYYSLYMDKFSESDYQKNYYIYKHVLVSRDSLSNPSVFPVNTKITMLDMVTNKYYYYVVTQDDLSHNKYVYNLSDFVAMGSEGNKYNDNDENKIYYNKDKDLVYENFIFHVDFGEANVQSDMHNNQLLMELRDNDQQTLMGVLGIQRDTMVYSVYKNKNAKINVSAETNTDTVYLGNNFDLNVTTDFTQNIIDSKTIYETKYFDNKMGIKISFIDNNGNQLNNESLLGVYFELDGKAYYPRFDGSTRINIADKVSNVLSKIKVNTKDNTTLATGTYTIRIESFGSPDGIYYGDTSSDYIEIKVNIVNSVFGLKVNSDDSKKIVDSKTGLINAQNNILKINVQYSSGLDNPNIVVCLYRRKYDSIYSQEYELVNLRDYASDNFETTSRPNEYVFEKNPVASLDSFIHLRDKLKTGTYKLVFKLYDKASFIGQAYEYVIIK